MQEFHHDNVISDLEINFSDLPSGIRKKIGAFKGTLAKTQKDYPGGIPKETMDRLKTNSLIIGEEIHNWHDENLEEEPINNPPNPPTMTPQEEALIARAKAVGLPETATEKEISAAEKAKEKLAERAKAVGLSETATEAEIEAAEKNAATEAEAKKALAKRAKAVGLTETATEAEIITAENSATETAASKEKLVARAKSVGLAETATEAEVAIAEKKKNSFSGNEIMDTQFGV